MSFIKKIFNPDPPKFIQPVMEDIPEVDDEVREEEVEQELTKEERRRKGRRSTILTSSQGLNEIEDENINKRTLLGG
tara:strand:+ start:401 stop:631 length:231 start_codon:yes stop_codon:yes gene_type:complete